jgi:type IV pilus assembly protein PilO
MNDFFDKLAKVPLPHKALAVVLLAALLVGGYYQLFYADLVETLARLDAEYAKLDHERDDYKKRKLEYHAFRQEVQRLLEEQKELLKVLPKSSEIPSFLDSLHTQATLAGLEIQTFTRLEEQPQDVYARIPVAMSVVGTYHQLAKFAKIVGELKRIVNIENLELDSASMHDGALQLRARFIAATFRFQDKPRGKK